MLSVNLSDPLLLSAARSLAPFYVRLGGSLADQVRRVLRAPRVVDAALTQAQWTLLLPRLPYLRPRPRGCTLHVTTDSRDMALAQHGERCSSLHRSRTRTTLARPPTRSPPILPSPGPPLPIRHNRPRPRATAALPAGSEIRRLRVPPLPARRVATAASLCATWGCEWASAAAAFGRRAGRRLWISARPWAARFCLRSMVTH